MTENITDELEPVEAAELLDVLEKGHQRAYTAAREAWPTQEHKPRLALANDLNELTLDEYDATLESGARKPGEHIDQFRERSQREQKTAAETDPEADPDDAEGETEEADGEPEANELGCLCSPENGLSGAESRPLKDWDLLHPLREQETGLVPLEPGTADFAFAHCWSPDGGRHRLFGLGSGRIIDGPEIDQREPGA